MNGITANEWKIIDMIVAITSQYHAYWCAGSLRRQVIISYPTDCVKYIDP